MTSKPKNIFVQGPISPFFVAESLEKHASKQEIGAHEIFLGQVRADEVAGRTVSAIRYTSYESMALTQMEQIRERIFSTYNLVCLHVYHSLGEVHAGQLCLFVFASSKHRSEAQLACRDIVEQIKKELPIWGEEIFEDNSSQWKTNT